MVGNIFQLVHVSVQKFEVHIPVMEIKESQTNFGKNENLCLHISGFVYFCGRTSFLCLHGVFCSLI